ncbi:MAG TPA: hypothetical protein PK771_07815 [Spirochaetota bacterium]|nr:hypothetical protein [Spirochaetota bacterium]
MFEQQDKRIAITFVEKLTENEAIAVRKELLNYEIEKKLFETVVLDLKSVKEIDFFGFQMIVYFYKYLLEFIGHNENDIIVNKSKEFINFEEKMGLKI